MPRSSAPGVAEKEAHDLLTSKFAENSYMELAAICGVSYVTIAKLSHSPDCRFPKAARRIVEALSRK